LQEAARDRDIDLSTKLGVDPDTIRAVRRDELTSLWNGDPSSPHRSRWSAKRTRGFYGKRSPGCCRARPDDVMGLMLFLTSEDMIRAR